VRTVQPKELSVEAFLPYGSSAQQIDPNGAVIGAPPVEFYRDMVQLNLGGHSIASLSTCRVESRDLVIDVSEYHSSVGEVILPLDNDILIHVAEATPPGVGVPVDGIEVFRVPRGTAVSLRPGIWHHAPFTVNGEPANVLIVLPERTYANDCVVVELAPEEQIRVVGV
jgi:ureidoglycolate lyase